MIAGLEAGVDFAEDDIDTMAAEEITVRIAEIEAPLRELERGFEYGRIVHDGLRLAIVGRPNAGKSSLFNRLVERDRAIVTATPGTTRDLVTERVAIEGIPVELIDTAGLREASDEAERWASRNRARLWPKPTWCCWWWTLRLILTLKTPRRWHPSKGGPCWSRRTRLTWVERNRLTTRTGSAHVGGDRRRHRRAAPRDRRACGSRSA